jgi:hypothetical protein
MVPGCWRGGMDFSIFIVENRMPDRVSVAGMAGQRELTIAMIGGASR